MPDLGDLLANAGPLGTFLRFLHRHTGRDDLFVVRGTAVVASGLPAGVFVVRHHWLLGDDPDDATALLADTLAAPSARWVYWGAPGAPGPLPDGWTSGTDRVFVLRPAPADTSAILSGDAFFAALDRLDPELADAVPPPAIRARLPFVFHGLEVDGRIVALCDTTVDDGDRVAIQQVETVARARGRGHATTLIRGVLGAAGRAGRGVIWVCDAENAASVALAARVGLSLHAELPLLVRRPVGRG